MKSGLISIIVPVYNVDKYLKECLDSILAQTYTNFEVILINDGSKDNSGIICDEYAQKDSRIKVIHQENKGVASTRNVGLDEATGDYICFVDSDDIVKNNYLEDFVNAMKSTGADIVVCNFYSERENSSDKENNNYELSAKPLRRFLFNDISHMYDEGVVLWNKIYKAELLKKYRFEVGKIHEDEFMINNLLYDTDKVFYIPNKNYHYRDNQKGITGIENRDNPEHIHAIDALLDRIDKAVAHDDKEIAEIALKMALLKLTSFYKNGSGCVKSSAKARYRDVYFEYSWLFDFQKKVKYHFFLIMPNVFCKMFI